MEFIALSVSMLSLLFVGGVTLFLRKYLPSYLSEKGKNLASKEDIAHITKEVESVKARYQSEVEKVKASLVTEGQVLERRRRVYEEMCNSMRIFIAGHGDTPEARDRFMVAYATAWLWASDEVLASLNQFLELKVQELGVPGVVGQSTLKEAYAQVVVSMRKDVGFSLSNVVVSDYKFVQFS